MTTPEARARETIDQMLQAAGWAVQSRDSINLSAGRGVAVREYKLNTGFADYLLFVDRKAIGVVEAKAEGATLSGVEQQSAKYSAGLPKQLTPWRSPLPFLYESTGVETFFTDLRDPDPRARRTFAFHRPETLLEWARESESFRARLRGLPPLVPGGLWPAQIEAIRNLEQSLAEDRPRALIQMATGSGKTITAINAVYRLIKHVRARRVLFLVDRANLGRQAMTAFQQFVAPDDGRKFGELYNIQHLQSNVLDPVCRVCITTIQRLYSMLLSEPELPAELEEPSLDELEDSFDSAPRQVGYNPAIPIEYFDLIITDECHRSIYQVWRPVLEYFDAHLVGLTATPSRQTLGFFNQNLVMEYSRQRAVLDGVNVDGEVYRIRTAISEAGGAIEQGSWVIRRNRRTRAERAQLLDEEFSYSAEQIDREVVAVDQIRTVVQTFRDKLFSELFPGRSEVPKTLIFAKDDSHAEQIVRIVREEFGRGNDFCQKITYRVTKVKPEDLIRDFRTRHNPRIAVTVDMIATGTDIKPLECLVFLRLVKSPSLFEQMLGRGTRVISPTDLQAVSADAPRKDRFIVVDAVGVVDHPKAETSTLERKRSVAFERLIELVASGSDDEDVVSSLAVRLARLHQHLSPAERYKVETESGGPSLRAIAEAMGRSLSPDEHLAAAEATGHAAPTPGQLAEAAAALRLEALRPLLERPALRQTIVELHQRDDLLIDEISKDIVREASFRMEPAARDAEALAAFQRFVAEQRDAQPALALLSQPGGPAGLTLDQLKQLAARIEQPPLNQSIAGLWAACAALAPGAVRGVAEPRVTTDLAPLVRYAVGLEAELTPYPALVRARYERWIARRDAEGRSFTPPQRELLDLLAEQIGVNLRLEPSDLAYGPLAKRGGVVAAMRAFGPAWRDLLDELNQALGPESSQPSA